MTYPAESEECRSTMVRTDMDLDGLASRVPPSSRFKAVGPSVLLDPRWDREGIARPLEYTPSKPVLE